MLLNACYEPVNVEALLSGPGVSQLLLFLMEDDQEVAANAAGAIQSICFQVGGLGRNGLGRIAKEGGYSGRCYGKRDKPGYGCSDWSAGTATPLLWPQACSITPHAHA